MQCVRPSSVSRRSGDSRMMAVFVVALIVFGGLAVDIAADYLTRGELRRTTHTTAAVSGLVDQTSRPQPQPENTDKDNQAEETDATDLQPLESGG